MSTHTVIPDGVRGVLAVVAHPDDESFGLGALLGRLAEAGVPTAVLCFTHGEASTLRAVPGDPHAVRSHELECAAAELGVETVRLSNHPDGALSRIPLHRLVVEVERMWAACHRPSHLLVFDPAGVTGHPDHRRATAAAMLAARTTGATVLAWTVPEDVADRLNTEFGTAFVGRPPSDCHVVTPVTRTRQSRAIACHVSQSTGNQVLWRRLELTGDREYVRLLGGGTDHPAWATSG
ncbi:PIG-L family deacetylase [Streptomyces beihaiensis]|uniref:PIG-L family deacetylase n=1 Tax=Streptomyces beihaiensis TaxID=2984495 RepID=A0ABT3TUD0_9ACTN|nr:PIG-L family deacetylase [Streptomyces beihaiensis]MCX3060635.1 PIG-L family deacetylase [Streptomyces beihaiensis]